MVILNKVIPINYNYMKKKFLEGLYGKVIKILDDTFYNCSDEDKKKYITYIHKNIIKESRNIFDSNHFIYLSMNKNYCTHIYKRGKMEGHICGAKIEIESDDYLCSRHNRKYVPKQRKYSMKNPRCKHIKENGNQCRHKCSKHKIYCYIHNNYYKEDNYEHIKMKNIEKLKIKRKLYFDMKKIKNSKNFKNSKISNFSKNSKIKNILFEYIKHNNIDINIFLKNKKKCLNKIYDLT